jgi:hypothetical protein
LHWILILIGLSTVVGMIAGGRERLRNLALLAFLIPLICILFYRNAFPYYYAFILAPAAILFAAAADRWDLRNKLWLTALVMTVAALAHYQSALSKSALDQRRTIAAIHTLFPAPVPYLDRCSMISSFPQAGVFLSSWWIENYQSAGRPIMRELLAARQPAFLIVNSPLLGDALEPRRDSAQGPQFLDEDKAALRSNFVHHWGPIWVAGKEVVVSPSAQALELLISGPYTLESRRPVSIDGRMLTPGGTMGLERGLHTLASPGGVQRVVLRWGEQLPRPAGTAPRELGFGRF